MMSRFCFQQALFPPSNIIGLRLVYNICWHFFSIHSAANATDNLESPMNQRRAFSRGCQGSPRHKRASSSRRDDRFATRNPSFERLNFSSVLDFSGWILAVVVLTFLVLVTWMVPSLRLFWGFASIPYSIWTRNFTRSLDQVSPGLTIGLCKMPAVPWVLDCGLANTAKPDIIVNQRNLNRLSDTVKALLEIPDHLTQATHLAHEFRRDLLPLSMNLPYSATHTLVKEVNILLVQIPSYARDLDTNLRLINYTATQLLRESTKGTQADDSVPSREPWRGVGTIWGGFHNQVVTHFSIFTTEFAKMHHKSEMLLLLCQTMSDGLETLRIETEQSQSNQAEIEQANKAIRFWKSSTTLNRDSTHALKMISHLSSVVENALDLLRKNHSAAETALASLRAAKRNIIAGKPDWRVLIGKRARHIPATLVDLEEARKLSLELLAYRIILRDKADPDYHSQMSKIRAGHGLH